MGNKLCDEQLEMSDFTLTIPSDGTGLLDVDKLDYCYKAGYNEMMQQLANIKSKLFK